MKTKKFIDKFIRDVVNENYATARDNLHNIIVEKMKNRIRNIEKEHKENCK